MTADASTRVLVRLAVRRDRVMLAATTLAIWILNYYSVVAMRDLYPDRASLVAANEASNASPGVVAMYGYVHDTASVGGVGANKVAMIDMIALALLVIALVRRHTRDDEERGRLELLGATPRIRARALWVAVTVAASACVICGLGSVLSLWAGGWPLTGSLLLGLAQTGVGLSFTGLAALAMQLSASTRSASMWAYGALGVAFLLRMVGDVRWNQPGAALSWLSPLGWAQGARPYDGNHAWALPIAPLFCLLTVAWAARLSARRDLGAGLLAARPGPGTGRIGTVQGLTWTLQKAPLWGWLVGYLAFGVLCGAIMGSLRGLITEDDAQLLRAMGGAGHLDDLYLTLVYAFAAFGSSAYAVSTVGQLRTEETQGRLEPVLAAPVSRLRYAWSHLGLALCGPVGLAAALGFGVASAHVLAGGSSGWWREFSPALVSLPGIWLIAAIAFLALSWAPRFDWLGWAVLGWVVVVQELGGLIGLPHRLMELSPFPHLPQRPVDAMTWPGVIVLCALSALLIGVAMVGYRRRDMPVG
ncbi:ABC-2 type transport system permease protein [Propionibacterium cyclohexanicum]|uniref:ABC-2 type transport system permease protein n=1 Tax=Propionibacterium cyclohexanicum TaxID=64702 RepID=A0A1H9RII0_9ACTN|nr:hypothetical protein [Propionibacterium cyclohexanicum]SER72428.1 ABC-2 type transport system permease protein [Propionibacterium cyclohexanicum]